MLCPKCGRINEDTNEQCYHCHYDFKSDPLSQAFSSLKIKSSPKKNVEETHIKEETTSCHDTSTFNTSIPFSSISFSSSQERLKKLKSYLAHDDGNDLSFTEFCQKEQIIPPSNNQDSLSPQNHSKDFYNMRMLALLLDFFAFFIFFLILRLFFNSTIRFAIFAYFILICYLESRPTFQGSLGFKLTKLIVRSKSNHTLLFKDACLIKLRKIFVALRIILTKPQNIEFFFQQLDNLFDSIIITEKPQN